MVLLRNEQFCSCTQKIQNLVFLRVIMVAFHRSGRTGHGFGPLLLVRRFFRGSFNFMSKKGCDKWCVPKHILLFLFIGYLRKIAYYDNNLTFIYFHL